MSPDDGRERILLAIESLATSAEPIQRRLEAAGGALLPLQPRDFTADEDRELFVQIIRALTLVEDFTGEQGALAVTVRSMSAEQAERVARDIVDLHRSVYPW